MESAAARTLTQTPRIYWLTEAYFPPQLGGLELMVARLSEGLAARGLEVHVVTRLPDPQYPKEQYIAGVHVRRIPPAGRLKGIGWRALPRVIEYLARLAIMLVRDARHYDVVIVSGLKVIPLIAVPLCHLLGKRCIVRVESTYELLEPVSAMSAEAMKGSAARMVQRFSEWIQRVMLFNADRVIATSNELQELVLEAGVQPEKISMIFNAVDLRRFHPVSRSEKERLRQELHLPRKATIVLFAARLSRAKGISLLVEAWPQLAAQHSDLCLVIVGAGHGSFDDCEAELVQFLQLTGLAGTRVLMQGPSERVDQYLQAADLYILPSEYEGFGVGVIEALATEIPVLATPVGVVPQLIQDGDNGFVFPPRDEPALIEAVETALAERHRWPEIVKRARKGVSSMDVGAVV
ncbi:MAG TPA: glycosyltransferase family 4 protein, partial [Steroidobacteraceae bacterium]|nr:glycosyltransferase family 4 protein [Steroidobacteraceae bacterium]